MPRFPYPRAIAGETRRHRGLTRLRKRSAPRVLAALLARDEPAADDRPAAGTGPASAGAWGCELAAGRLGGEDGGVRISGSHPVLAVHDLDRSGAWYRDVLGCELEDPDPGNWRFCRAGEVILTLGQPLVPTP